jgi:hypothetical protein
MSVGSITDGSFAWNPEEVTPMRVHSRGNPALLSLVGALLVAGLVGCSTSPSGDGTVRLLLVDAPAPIQGIEAVDIVFSKLLIHRNSDADTTDGEWITVFDETLPEADRSFDLLSLVNGASVVLGETELEERTYSQIRIFIQSATVTIDGVTSPLSIPSGDESGLKLVNAFHISDGVVTELMLDFDVGESVWENPPGSGQYKLSPTIRMVETILSGTISGTVSPVGIDALVTAYTAGTTDVVTSTYVDPVTGDYALTALLAGDYDIEVSAPGYVTTTEDTITVVAAADDGGHDFTLVVEGIR